MKFSVLMSVYKNDSAEYLELALESIYDNQTKKPDEIVVVFDGPLNDGLYRVLDEFALKHPSITHYYPQEVNRGLGEALRIGAEKCTGDYIFRMDSDDVSAPERFEKQIAFINSHPDIDVVGTDIAEFDQNATEENKRVRACPAYHDDIVRMGKKRNPMNHVTTCIRRKALDACGGYESLLLLEDYYLWLKMIVSGCRLANINESLVYVRVGNGFNSKRGSKTRIKGWKTLQTYMLRHGMITKFEAALNMCYIRVFTCIPASIRKFVYNRFLRQ